MVPPPELPWAVGTGVVLCPSLSLPEHLLPRRHIGLPWGGPAPGTPRGSLSKGSVLCGLLTVTPASALKELIPKD